MTVVVTIKTGDRYPSFYVNRLRNGLMRHGMFAKFYCITDNPAGLAPDIHHLRFSSPTFSYWDKLYLFSWEHGIKDRILYFDLDMLVLGGMQFLLDYDGGFATCSRFDDHNQINSTIMNIPYGYGKTIWEAFLADKDVMGRMAGDSNFVESRVGSGTYRFDKKHPGFLRSYKKDIREKGIPEGTKIISFHGKPDIHEVNEPFIAENWR